LLFVLGKKAVEIYGRDQVSSIKKHYNGFRYKAFQENTLGEICNIVSSTKHFENDDSKSIKQTHQFAHYSTKDVRQSFLI
jgi:hypothetical protein